LITPQTSFLFKRKCSRAQFILCKNGSAIFNAKETQSGKPENPPKAADRPLSLRNVQDSQFHRLHLSRGLNQLTLISLEKRVAP